MEYPIVHFRAGEEGILHSNINFARQAAEEEAERTKKVTTLYQVTNNNATPIQEISPQKKQPLFHEVWFPNT